MSIVKLNENGIVTLDILLDASLVRCHNCYNIFYDSIDECFPERERLILLSDKHGELYHGCPNCETAEYLSEVDLDSACEQIFTMINNGVFNEN